MSHKSAGAAVSLEQQQQPMMKHRQATEETWDYCEDEDEGISSLGDPLKFLPLNGSLSYRSTEEPPALEVIPTRDICRIPITNTTTNNSMMKGIPVLNTSSVLTKSGKKITKKHAQYALTAGMILGIRECVGGVEALREAELEKDEILRGKQLKREWGRIRKYDFEANRHCISSHYNSSPLPYGYEFKAYAPLIFARIRSAFGVENQSFLHSICGHFNFVEFMSNAKSGQFFFFSHDGQYMIKTMTNEESIFLHEILRHYYTFLMDNPHSFLTHFYGMYRVKMPEQGRSVHFCIMKSVFNTEREIHKTWDLKGSTKGRRAKRGDSVHKDLDILDEGRKLHVGASVKEAVMAQLRRDATFLARLGIMDYSILLGVHHRVDYGAHAHRPSLGRTNTPFRRRFLDQVEINGEHSRPEDKLNSGMLSEVSGDDSGSEITEDSTNLDRKDLFAMSAFESFGEIDVESDSMHSDDMLLGSEKLTRRSRSGAGSVSSALSATHFMRRDSNPMTQRQDLGIESSGHTKHTREIYFLGIIDILQEYNARKWGETVMRKAAGNAESSISCVDPETYANRFVKFMSALME